MRSIFISIRAVAVLLLVTISPLVFAGDPSSESSASDLKFEAGRKFAEQYGNLLTEYRKGLAEAVGKADRIEIFLLSFDGIREHKSPKLNLYGPVSDEIFPVRPYASETKILQKRVLTRAEQDQLLPLLMSTIVASKADGGAFCHFPIHGLRVFSGEEMVFESSFCYECNNFWVDYPSEPIWVGLGSKDFQELMTKLMPIPESETKRFKASLSEKKDEP